MDRFVSEMINAVIEFFVLLIVGTISGIAYLIRWSANRNR